MILAGCELSGRSGHDAAYALLEKLYREETGLSMPAIVRTPRGKPYWENSPWHFSLTHTGGHAFCALSRVPVGIDAEEEDREIRLSLAEKILSPMEKAQFDDSRDPRRALLTFWVLKEAAAKCSGEGLRGYPNHTEFSLDDPRVTHLHGCIVAVMEEGESHAV